MKNDMTLMASSSKWAAIISSIAFSVYFSLVILQVPLFRVSCGQGLCKSPMEVTCYQLVIHQVIPSFVAKALLYPGAIANAIVARKNVPSLDKLLHSYNFTDKSNSAADLLHLEVIIGSYLAVGGAFLGIVNRRPGRMSFFGTLCIIWGILRQERLLTKRKAFSINYSTMFIVMISAFLSITRDVRKLVRSCKASVRSTTTDSKPKNT